MKLVDLKKLSKRIAITSFIFLYSLLSLSVCSAQDCSTGQVSLTEEQSTMLLQILEAQEKELTEALELLIEAQTDLEESNNQLTLSKEELIESQQELVKQKREITRLKAQLMELKQGLDEASTSIKLANQSLEQAKSEFEAVNKANKQKINSLKGEKVLWQIISVILGAVAVGK